MEIKIKINSHRSFNLPRLRTNCIKGTVVFCEDFEYIIDKQEDTNKLIGLSDSYYHMKNSIRIGWRWNTEYNKIEIRWLLHNNYNISSGFITFIESNVEYDYCIKINKSDYTIFINNNIVVIPRNNNWFLPRYVLYPYFGGNTKAPKEFNFKIKI